MGLISIIMPVFNAQSFLKEGIESVISQTYPHWELLIINDGSIDESKKIISSFVDSRIRYVEQENKGVAAARNVGLSLMKGDYFCFLDADDVLTENSLYSRLEIFRKNQDIEFVDGRVFETSSNLEEMTRDFIPSFRGNPFQEMLKLKDTCYLGLTWMIKRRINYKYKMTEGQTHGEDFIFLLSLSRQGGLYDFTEDVILLYRRNFNSAMNNLNGLDNGYLSNYREIKRWKEVRMSVQFMFWLKTRKIMFLCYLFLDRSLKRAFLTLFKF